MMLARFLTSKKTGPWPVVSVIPESDLVPVACTLNRVAMQVQARRVEVQALDPIPMVLATRRERIELHVGREVLTYRIGNASIDEILAFVA